MSLTDKLSCQFTENACYRYFCGEEADTCCCERFRFGIHENEKAQAVQKTGGIGPALCHCKAEHPLGRDSYKGFSRAFGKVMPSADGSNFKRAMRVLLRPIGSLLSRLYRLFWGNPGHKGNEKSNFLLSRRCAWDFAGTL